MIELTHLGLADTGLIKESYESLSLLISAEGDPDEFRIREYLTSGYRLLILATVSVDVLRSDQRTIGNNYLQTDGRWLWTSTLEYYVRVYHVRLPKMFMSHARGQNWTIPQLSKWEVANIFDQLQKD